MGETVEDNMHNHKIVFCLAMNTSDFPGGSNGKESACSAGDLGSIPGLGKNPLEKGLATRSSIIAWEIPRTEEPGGLQSVGSQRVRND